MGVGVYHSDFQGTGGVILVDGPIGTDEDYQGYVEEMEKDGEEPVDRETWEQQEVDDFEDNLKHTVVSALQKLGFDPSGSRERASFDSDFVSLADRACFEGGYRSWQHDYVVAVAGNPRRIPEEEGLDFVVEHGRTREAWQAMYDSTLADLLRYVRISLQEEHIDCKVRTSGYTTSMSPKEENPLAVLESLRASLVERLKGLDLDRELALKDATREERVAIVAACEDAYSDSDEFPGVGGDVNPVVPVYDPEHDSITLFSPFEVGPQAQMMVPEQLRGTIAAFEGDDALFPIPRNAATESWFRSYRTMGMTLLVAADEFAEGAKRDCVVAWNDEPDIVRVTLATAPVLAPSP